MDKSAASLRKSDRICPEVAPRARARPISEVRSLTEIHMIVRMPMEPTNKEMAPMPPDRHAHDANDPVQGLQHAGLGGDGEVLLLSVPLDENLFDALDHRIDHRGVGDQHIDLMQGVAVEQLPRRGHRDVGAVVDVKPKELSFRLHQANHHEPLAGDADMPAEAVLIAEQLPLELWAEDSHRRGLVRVRRGQKPAAAHAHAPEPPARRR